MRKTLRAFWVRSQTKLLALWVAVTGAAGIILPWLAGLLVDPSVSAALQAVLPSDWVWLYTIAMAVLIYVAHGHKGEEA